ncbi:hypothetical protein ACIO3R_01510 [Streptomyces sp. NPDC087428]|uniref:hypothetical protein n=1 Tax=Streptomyces sp. NPDC087428 TaxID=3365788 RepID=UPI003818CF97
MIPVFAAVALVVITTALITSHIAHPRRITATTPGTPQQDRAAIEETHVLNITPTTDRVAQLEAQLAEYEVMNPQQCPKGLHADWLVDSEHTHACPWCRIVELEATAPARLVLGTTGQQPETAPADLRVLVDRLAAHAAGFADVLDESDRGPWGRLVRADIDELRAAVAAPVDRATEFELRGDTEIRAAALNEAADLLTEIGTPIFGNRSEHERGLMYGAERLRRLADEAQQPTPC